MMTLREDEVRNALYAIANPKGLSMIKVVEWQEDIFKRISSLFSSLGEKTERLEPSLFEMFEILSNISNSKQQEKVVNNRLSKIFENQKTKVEQINT